jgi:hypothetical protein
MSKFNSSDAEPVLRGHEHEAPPSYAIATNNSFHSVELPGVSTQRSSSDSNPDAPPQARLLASSDRRFGNASSYASESRPSAERFPADPNDTGYHRTERMSVANGHDPEAAGCCCSTSGFPPFPPSSRENMVCCWKFPRRKRQPDPMRYHWFRLKREPSDSVYPDGGCCFSDSEYPRFYSTRTPGDLSLTGYPYPRDTG